MLVGSCSLGEGWCTLPNVSLLCRKTYPRVPAYMLAWDMPITTRNDYDWIRACNPVNLKEYLAVVRPELCRYEGC